jgi:hypothetical protein
VSVRASATALVRSGWNSGNVRAGETRQFDVRLARGNLVRIRVVSADSGLPIQDASVSLLEGGVSESGHSILTNRPELGQARTDLTGEAVFAIPDKGMATAFVLATGHARYMETLEAAGRAPAEVLVVARLAPGVALTCLVTDPVGRVAPQARVYAVPAPQLLALANPDWPSVFNGLYVLPFAALSDAHGRAELTGLEQDGDYVVIARADPWCTSEPGHFRHAADGGAATLPLRLRRPGALVVQVPGGLDDVRLTLRTQLDGGFDFVPLDNENSFVADELPPGRHELEVEVAGRRVRSQEVVVTEGHSSRVSLEIARSVEISGAVTTGDLGPVGGVHVHAVAALGSEFSGGSAVTGPDGRFSLTVNGSGVTYTLRVVADGYAQQRPLPEVTSPTTGVHVPVVRHGTLRLRVAGDSVSDDDLVFIVQYASGFPQRHLRLPRTDTFALRECPPGAGSVRVYSAIGAPSDVPFDLEEGTELDLGTVQLQPGAAVEGVVVTPTGTPVSDARLAVVDSNTDWEYRTTRTGANGSFNVEGVEPGTVEFRIDHGARIQSVRQTVVAPRSIVEIVLPTGD